jgi:Zn-finger nucleic acid-binding protein
MKCPACSDILLTLEYNDIEVDFCASCQGIWLDAGELELLMDEASAKEGCLTGGRQELASGEKSRPCPICDTAMDKEVTRGSKPVVYDSCPKGDGLWFDRGELLTILDDENIEGDVNELRLWLKEFFPGSGQPQQDDEEPHKGVL